MDPVGAPKYAVFRPAPSELRDRPSTKMIFFCKKKIIFGEGMDSIFNLRGSIEGLKSAFSRFKLDDLAKITLFDVF